MLQQFTNTNSQFLLCDIIQVDTKQTPLCKILKLVKPFNNAFGLFVCNFVLHLS